MTANPRFKCNHQDTKPRRKPFSSLLRAFMSSWLLFAAVLSGQAPKIHELPLKPESVHWGYYDARVPPVLRIASGDRVRVETMVAGGLQRLRLAGATRGGDSGVAQGRRAAVTERGPGAHPMSGPIFVEGAEPGDTLGDPDRRDRVSPHLRRECVQSGRRCAAGRVSVRAAAVCSAGPPARIASSSAPGDHAAARAVFRIHRRRASAARRAHLEPAARLARRQSGQQGSRGGLDPVPAGPRCRARCCRSATVMRCRATAK